jgi:hypothetical protein
MKKLLKGIVAATVLSLAGAAGAAQLTLAQNPLWTAPVGNANYPFITNDNNQRGLAFNPVTGNVLVANKPTSATAGVYVLNGQTGAVLGNLNTSGIAGGTFLYSMMGIGDDGAIYAANLTTDSSGTGVNNPLKIYRWASESAGLTSGGNIAPTLVYSGDPMNGTATAVRFGDSIDVIGSGANTQIILGARNAVGATPTLTFAVLKPTANPDQFASTPVSVAGTNAGNVSVAWEDADTIWQKNTGFPARRIDIAGAVGTLTNSATPAPAPATSGPLGIDDANDLMGVIKFQSSTSPGASLYLYDITNPSTPIELANRPFASNPITTNGNGVGSVDFGRGVVYALDTNNGIIAYQLVPIPEPGSVVVLSLGAIGLLLRRRA